MNTSSNVQASIPQRFGGKTIKTGLKVTTAALPGEGGGWVKVDEGARAQRGNLAQSEFTDEGNAQSVLASADLSGTKNLSLSLSSTVRPSYKEEEEEFSSVGGQEIGAEVLGGVSKDFPQTVFDGWEGLHG